jgi:transposase InsO family protein
MSDNPSKLSVPLLEEANYPTWRPAMEARLRQLSIFRIVTGETQELLPPGLILHTQDTQGHDEPLPQAALILNGQMTLEYQKQLSAYCKREEKAAGDILAYLSCSQQTHVKDKGSDAKGIWDALKLVHVQQVPGMRFSAYNELFSVTKGADETLPAVASCVEDLLARVKELRPAVVRLATGTCDYGVNDLDNELALMAMLRALPREYGDFMSLLICQKDLTRGDVEAAFQVEQTERDAHRSPLLSPSGDAALRANAAGLPRQNKPGVKCGFCTGKGHDEDTCFKKDRTRKDSQKAVKERRTNRDGSKKGRANRAATPSSSSPAPSDGAKVMELAASASVRLAGSPDTHADAHWIADTGATSRMSPHRSWFTKLEPLAIPIRIANDHVVYSEGVGSVVLEPADKSLCPVLLSHVLYVPASQNNLLSVLHLVANHRFRIEIEGKEMVFLQSGKHRFTAAIHNNTAWLNASTPPAPEAALHGEAVMTCALWHRRLCHISADCLEQALKGKVATGLVVESDAPVPTHCELCIRGKHHRNPFPQRASHRAKLFLERIHSDLHQLPVATSTGFCYWLLFIDDYSRYFWIYLLRKKSETFDVFTQFKAMVEKQFDQSILCLHGDKGGEFIGIKWDTFFVQHGIRHKHTVKVLPQQDGVAERLNRTLKELLIAMLHGARLPARFWGEGLNYLRHVIVRSPSSSIPPGTTPYDMAHKRKPDYSPLRLFGCCTWVHIQRKKCKSLQDHAKPCVFLGCPEDFKGWKLWDLSANGGRGGVIVSRNIVWNEDKFPGTSRIAHDAIPERFGRPAEPGDVELSPDEEEVSDSTDLERVTIPPPFEPAVPPSDSNSSSSSSRSSSTASPTPSPPGTPPRPAPVPAPATPCRPPQAAAHGPLSAPRPATRIPPWPALPKRPLPAPAEPAPAPRARVPVPAPALAVDAPKPAGLRRSARSNTGVAPPPD